MILAAIILVLSGFVLFVTITNVLLWHKLRPVPSFNDVRPERTVSVVIPARNEERVIKRCVHSVLQQGSIVREVIVYNDQSTDDTAGRVLQLSQHDARVRLVNGTPLPRDWYGKPYACHQAAQHAQSPWILFLDADAMLQPDAVDALVTAAVDHRCTMLSAWPGFDLVTAAEKTLMPMLNFFVFTIFPAFAASRLNDQKYGLAHGACMLFHRETYTKLGGHSMVQKELFEDTAIARMWRRNGERSLCLDGQDVVRVRMYSTLGEIWRGFMKNFYPGFRTQTMFWLFLIFHFSLFFLPFVAAPFVVDNILGAALITAAVSVLMDRIVLALRFHEQIRFAFLHPIAQLFVIALGIASWWNWSFGPGVRWKDRSYTNDKSAVVPMEGVSK